MKLESRIAELEGGGDYLSIGELLDRLESGEPLDAVSLEMADAINALEG